MGIQSMEIPEQEIDLLLYNGKIANAEMIKNASIAINHGIIIDIGENETIAKQYHSKKKINVNGDTVFPGLINTHSHTFQTYIKGHMMSNSLYDWLNGVIVPLCSELTPEDVYWAAKFGAIEAMTTGTTSILDFMYVSHQGEFADAAIAGLLEAGIRVAYGRGIITQGYSHPLIVQKIEDALRDIERLIQKAKRVKDSMLTLWAAPGGLPATNFGDLVEIANFSRTHDLPVTIHFLETEYDDLLTKRNYNMDAVEYLEKAGLLDRHLLLAHGVHIPPDARPLFLKDNISIAHCPDSNLHLGSGIAPVKMLKNHLNIALGTDGPIGSGENMLQTMREAVSLPRGTLQDAQAFSTGDVLDMATVNGAKALGLEDEIGKIEIGKRADLFILKENTPGIMPLNDPKAGLIFYGESKNITDVVINGELVVENNEVKTISMEETYRQILKRNKRILNNMKGG